MGKATGLVFPCLMLLQLDMCLLAYRNTYNAFFMGLPVSYFVSHLSLLPAKSVDLAVVHDGFPSQWKSYIFFTATLIAEVLFEHLLICNAV